MANALFCYPDYISSEYGATFSGGSWLASLPLTNLRDPRMHRVARSTNAALVSTQLDIDLKKLLYARAIAIPKHNLSRGAKIRVSAYDLLPFINWRTVGDADWSVVGTPTRTAAATYVNGIPLDLIGDDSATDSELAYRTIGFTGNGQKVISFLIKRFSAYNVHQVHIYDNALGYKGTVNINFTNPVPIVTAQDGATIISTVAEDTGYRVTFLTAVITSANPHSIKIAPAPALVADTASFYIGDIKAWNASTEQQKYDSSWKDVYPVIYPSGVLPFGHPSYYDGKLTQEEWNTGYPMPFTLIPDVPKGARYWRIEVDDTANAAGYIDLARLVLAFGYQPTINISYGAKLGWQSDSTKTRMYGGATIKNKKKSGRLFNFVLDHIPQDEAMVYLFEIPRKFGITDPFYFIFDPSDTFHMHRRSMLCTMREMNPVDYPYFNRMAGAFSLEEEL